MPSRGIKPIVQSISFIMSMSALFYIMQNDYLPHSERKLGPAGNLTQDPKYSAKKQYIPYSTVVLHIKSQKQYRDGIPKR